MVESPPGARRPLGQILVEQAKLTPQQLQEALSIQKGRSQRLGELLCQLGHLDSRAVVEALVEQAGLGVVDADKLQLKAEVVGLIPAEMAFRCRILPIEAYNETLCLAMADPFDRLAVESARVLSGRQIERRYCPENQLLDATRRVYGSSVARMIADLGDGGVEGSEVSEEQVTSQLQEGAGPRAVRGEPGEPGEPGGPGGH